MESTSPADQWGKRTTEPGLSSLQCRGRYRVAAAPPTSLTEGRVRTHLSICLFLWSEPERSERGAKIPGVVEEKTGIAIKHRTDSSRHWPVCERIFKKHVVKASGINWRMFTGSHDCYLTFLSHVLQGTWGCLRISKCNFFGINWWYLKFKSGKCHCGYFSFSELALGQKQ